MIGQAGGLLEAKRALRQRVLVRRERMPAPARAGAGAALAAAARTLVVTSGARRVAAYWAVGGEPPTAQLLSALATLGTTILLPLVRDDGLLDWAAYQPGQPVTPGRFGIPEPFGPRLGPDALASVDVALVPALAVDRGGARLGRGGGYVDRSLARGERPRRVVAVVYDVEVFDFVPVGPQDVLVDAALHPASH